jgi:hypothetical protein
MADFEPITTQEEFNERIKGRLARERERWEKESGLEDLKAQLEAKDAEIAETQKAHRLKLVERDVKEALAERDVKEPGRVKRAMSLMDLDAVEVDENGDPIWLSARGQVDQVARDIPELVPRLTPSGGGSTERIDVTGGEKPLTEAEVRGMSEDEINSNWERIKAFMAGERS